MLIFINGRMNAIQVTVQVLLREQRGAASARAADDQAAPDLLPLGLGEGPVATRPFKYLLSSRTSQGRRKARKPRRVVGWGSEVAAAD